MEFGLINSIQSAIILILDLYVFSKAYNNRNTDRKHRYYYWLAISASLAQSMSFLVRLIKTKLVYCGITLQYIIYITMFITMAFTAWGAMRYLLYLRDRSNDLSTFIKHIMFFPCIVMIVTSISSPWTHWLFYLDESLNYHRGTLFILQIVCPYIYALIAIIIMVIMFVRRKETGEKQIIRYFMCFLVPSITGAVLQVVLNIDGGYSSIGISLSVILLYVEFYVDEIREMEQQKENQQQLNIVNALSRDYLNVYVIDPTNNRVHVVKLNGYITRGMSAEKDNYPYDELCKQYISHRVFVDDIEMMTEVMDINNILKNLENAEDYVGIYRVIDNDIVHFYQYKYAKLSDTNNIIAGFQNVDQMIAKEKLQQKQLAEALEKAERANIAKTVFINNMSHDIRTPMNAILGYTELMQKYAGDEERFYDYLGKIRKSGDFLLSLINNVLEMAKIESGNVKLTEEPCSTSLVSDEIYSVYSEPLRMKNIEFINILDVKTPYVYADKVKLNEIFLNLVSNAYKYTPEGGKISISIIELPCDIPEHVTIQATVADTGIGISKDYMNRIFEEFSRERSVTETKIPGTGLGMPIVKKLVELMNGTITVESEIGKGTTFVVTTHHRIADAPDTLAEDQASTTVSSKSFIGKRLLLAEDNELNAEIAMEILSGLGFKIDHAEDGIICVDMLSREEAGYYDAILMDIQMPNMDGYKATEMIRKLADPQKANIPIFALTANAFEEDKQHAIEAKMNGHIAKPIEISKLIETLNGLYIRSEL